MRYDIPAAAAEIAQSQAGAISRKQLLDAYYEEYKLAAELDGRLAHPDQERWRDTHRDNQAGAQGILTTRYGWREVYGHPCETALLQARILQRRGWTGSPRPCSATCPVGRGKPKIDLRTLRRSRQPARQAPRLTSEARRKRDAEPRLLPGTRSCGTAGNVPECDDGVP